MLLPPRLIGLLDHRDPPGHRLSALWAHVRRIDEPDIRSGLLVDHAGQGAVVGPPGVDRNAPADRLRLGFRPVATKPDDAERSRTDDEELKGRQAWKALVGSGA